MNVFSYGNVTVIFAKSIANSVSFDTFCKKYQKVSTSMKKYQNECFSYRGVTVNISYANIRASIQGATRWAAGPRNFWCAFGPKLWPKPAAAWVWLPVQGTFGALLWRDSGPSLPMLGLGCRFFR